MVGILIVTHGRLAPELLATAQTILGREIANARAVSLDWSEGWDEARTKIGAAIASFPTSTETFLVLTDLHGDTPSRAAASLREEGRVEVITGVNLPMVVRLGCADEQALPVDELARWIEIKGRRSIRRASTTPARDREPAFCGAGAEEGEPR